MQLLNHLKVCKVEGGGNDSNKSKTHSSRNEGHNYICCLVWLRNFDSYPEGRIYERRLRKCENRVKRKVV
jgi:hypothetical protein